MHTDVKHDDGSNFQQPSSGERLHGLLRELSQVAGALERMAEAIHLATGLSSTQRFVLYSLQTTGPTTVPELAFQRGISRQALQKVVDALKDAGYLTLSANPRHKRSLLLRITPGGAAVLQQALEQEYALIGQLALNIEASDIDTVRRVLAELNRAMSQPGREGHV